MAKKAGTTLQLCFTKVDGWARAHTHTHASVGLHHPLSTCCLASRWKEDMAFLRSFYVADDIW